MKRFLLVTLVIGLLGGQANAALFEMDAATAADMRQVGSAISGTGALEYVGYNDGQNPGDEVYGPTWDAYDADSMIYAVGFSGDLRDDSSSGGLVSLTIGLYDGGASLGLAGDYNRFSLPIANDNDDVWQYRAYVTVNDTTTTYSDGGSWISLDPDTSTALIVDLGLVDIDFADVTGIGFQVQWDRSLNEGRRGDFFSTSVVPVPGAVLLGLLGLGVAGIKLRKYA